MSRILVLTDRDDIAKVGTEPRPDTVLLLFWASPETRASLESATGAPTVPLEEVVGDLASVIGTAYARSHAVVENAPTYRGVSPLLGFETSLADVLLPDVVAEQVVDLVTTTLARPELVFRGPSPWATSIAATAEASGSATVRRPAASTAARDLLVVRAVGRAMDTLANRDWDRLRHQVVQRAGPRWHRRRTTEFRSGGAWAFASYVNYARSLTSHLAARSDVRWLVNGYSGARGLPPGARASHLWDVGGLSPRARHREVTGEVLSHLRTAIGVGASNLMAGTVRDALTEIDMFHAFIDTSHPEELWVANQWGSESALVQIARAARIPVTQVQHGVLEHYYRWAPIYTDRFLVWGEAWKECVPTEHRGQVEVVDPGIGAGDVPPRSRGRTAASTTVFTAPPIQPFWNPSVVYREFAHLARGVLRDPNATLLLRVHPLDRLRPWTTSVRKIDPEAERRLVVVAGGSLGETLARTRTAVLYRSTVFLSCLAAGIPVVALGWYRWVWDDLLEKIPAVALAQSIDDAIAACASPPRDMLLGDVRRLLAGIVPPHPTRGSDERGEDERPAG